jgi:beta-lactamase class D
VSAIRRLQIILAVDIVKEIITLEQTDSYKLSGKTGGGPIGERALGWFVGRDEDNRAEEKRMAIIHLLLSTAWRS